MTAKNTHRPDCKLRQGHTLCHCVCLLWGSDTLQAELRALISLVAERDARIAELEKESK
jgi:hypothetical protein